MKFKVTSLAAASLFTVAAAAHAQATGVSHPEELNDTITTTTPAPAHYQKPSPAIPVVAAPVEPVSTTETASATPPALHVHAEVRPPSARRADDDDRIPHVDPDDPNSGVIVAIHARPNELPEGTSLRAALDNSISTTTAVRGNHFTAHLTADVARDGKVFLPVGSVIRGRITEVRTGKTFGGGAMLHLQPDTVTLPDGIPYPLDAQVVDLDPDSVIGQDSHVSEEGQIIANKHAKAKIAAVSLGTGSGAVAGALVGGGVGALVGATIGAGAGVVVLAKQDQQQTLPEGTVLVLNLDHSLILNGN